MCEKQIKSNLDPSDFIHSNLIFIFPQKFSYVDIKKCNILLGFLPPYENCLCSEGYVKLINFYFNFHQLFSNFKLGSQFFFYFHCIFLKFSNLLQNHHVTFIPKKYFDSCNTKMLQQRIMFTFNSLNRHQLSKNWDKS